MTQKIIIIDDNITICKQLTSLLREAGYETKVFLEGESALREWIGWKADLFLLDIHLPGVDGFSVCRTIRQSSDVPILAMSANLSSKDKIRILDLGADVCMSKPFNGNEMLAQIRALLRRSQNTFDASASPVSSSSTALTGDYVSYPGLLVNQTSYLVIYDGQEISMPPKELELLYCLASSPNRVFTREQLLDLVWGYDYLGDARTVDVHIKRIREKIKDHETWSLSTVWGVGYKFSTSTQT